MNRMRIVKIICVLLVFISATAFGWSAIEKHKRERERLRTKVHTGRFIMRIPVNHAIPIEKGP
jgi:HAMP domain-containing protein